MVASTWLGDHQERPSAPTNNLHNIMARYQVHQLQNSVQSKTLTKYLSLDNHPPPTSANAYIPASDRIRL